MRPETFARKIMLAVWMLGAISCCLFLVTSGWGQTIFGTITGTVTDQSGAAVPAATVTVTNEATGIQRRISTTATGVYAVPDLGVGSYRVRAEKPGFRAYEEAGVHLNANRTVNVDARLQVASTGTTVEVTSAAPPLNTQTGTLANTTLPTQLQQLPVITRQKGGLLPLFLQE